VFVEINLLIARDVFDATDASMPAMQDIGQFRTEWITMKCFVSRDFGRFAR
jgi:hypothetical protein